LYYYIYSMDDIGEYIRCRNCGKHVLKEDAYNNYFCSSICSQKFAHCKNCGAFFPVSDSQYAQFCSKECAVSWEHPLKEVPHYQDDDEGVII